MHARQDPRVIKPEPKRPGGGHPNEWKSAPMEFPKERKPAAPRDPDPDMRGDR